MIIIFSYRAILSALPGIAIGACVQRFTGHEAPGVVLGALVCIAIDLADRWHNGKSDNRYVDFLHPRSGGHIFFIPMWVWAILMMVGGLAGGHQP